MNNQTTTGAASAARATRGTVDALADSAMDAAVIGAMQYLRTRGYRTREAVEPIADALAAAVTREARAAIGRALHDAREAIEARVGAGVAEATFRATMTLAGIAAARSVVGELDVTA